MQAMQTAVLITLLDALRLFRFHIFRLLISKENVEEKKNLNC